MAPKTMPKKTMQTNIVTKDIIKVDIPAFRMKKNGNEGIIPPIRGAVPFMNETKKLANLSAFS